ncbi:hypothetical protein AB0I00_29400 [Streptomyces sp. NPDC050803]|uniref:hypothetical protein n=1 Tax=unclassified Streptomyces TaxID=2593676 RepID=UPI003423CEF8
MRRRTGEDPRTARTPHASRIRNGGAALAALCALALTACGTERQGDAAPKAAAEHKAVAAASTPRSTESEESQESETEGADFLPFMELLVTLVEPCAKEEGLAIPTLPPEEHEEQLSGPAEEPPTPLPSDLAVPDEGLPAEPPPSAEPTTPETDRAETELSSLEECEADIHTRRITKALAETPNPTPQQVTDTLHTLGYIDERIDGPQLDGEKVNFTLDLRIMDGQLCLSGSTTGTHTTIDPYGASPEVDCTAVDRTP